MIKSVVRTFYWEPNIIKDLYHDGIDYQGLIYWYDDVDEVVKNMKSKK